MIVNDIRPIMKAAQPGVPDTWDNLYSFFLNRVRDNLHVMLCFSPVGDKFARRAMQFPGLINGCTIDWFLPWPEEALTSGARAGCVLAAESQPPPSGCDDLVVVMHACLTCSEHHQLCFCHTHPIPPLLSVLSSLTCSVWQVH
jgi:hypothetical protein